jgi:hypothetical protein
MIESFEESAGPISEDRPLDEEDESRQFLIGLTRLFVDVYVGI